jgi:hypothetical protein
MVLLSKEERRIRFIVQRGKKNLFIFPIPDPMLILLVPEYANRHNMND